MLGLALFGGPKTQSAGGKDEPSGASEKGIGENRGKKKKNQPRKIIS